MDYKEIKFDGFDALEMTTSQAQYPMGCNLAVYVGPDNFMVEMVSYGAERTVLHGRSIYNREIWKLVVGVIDWDEPNGLITQVQ